LKDYRENIEKGLNFYYSNQFDAKGRSLWRMPKKWPIDIHNQSQGIITFTIFKDLNDNYPRFAEKIANWTINNMQSADGRFSYQKWPILLNKVSYMRWNQAWMLLALSTLLSGILHNNQ